MLKIEVFVIEYTLPTQNKKGKKNIYEIIEFPRKTKTKQNQTLKIISVIYC